MKKMLIVYYSYSNGNTERIAKMLKEKTDADILKIDTAISYSGSYDEIVKQGQDEVSRAYKPKLKDIDVDISDYDVIVLGTPTWWYTMAPAMLSFLSEHRFNDKIVVPYMTNGGWPGHVISDIKKQCSGAIFKYEKEITFDSSGGDILITPLSEINKWIDEVSKLLWQSMKFQRNIMCHLTP